MTSINPYIYQALVIAKGLEVYARTGMKLNSSYKPASMMKTASAITNQRFRARDYLGAAKALRDWVDGASRQPEPSATTAPR